MREKLLDLMKNEGLKPSQLAELLGITPAGISHILAGRNKPGFDLLQKILRRFPRINPDWLLLDSDKMYRDEPPAQSSAPQPMSQPASPGGDLFGLASGRHPLEEKRQPETAENQLELIPAGRWGHPYEMGALTAFLCSSGAGYINGVDILADGGQNAGIFVPQI